MANEDVLERAEALLAECVGYELPAFTDSLIVEDLAAEVRELRSKLMQIEVKAAVKEAIREANAEIAALDAAMGHHYR